MAPIGVEKPRRARFFFIVAGYSEVSEFSEFSEFSEDSDGMEGNFDSFEKSRNAFGTAHRPGGRLLLCDFAALRLPFGVTMSFAAFGTARHFVTLASKSS